MTTTVNGVAQHFMSAPLQSGQNKGILVLSLKNFGSITLFSAKKTAEYCLKLNLVILAGLSIIYILDYHLIAAKKIGLLWEDKKMEKTQPQIGSSDTQPQHLEIIEKAFHINNPDPNVRKITAAFMMAVYIPVLEEIQIRGLIQDVLLKRIPQLFLKRICPGQEKILDSTIAQIACITISASIFSAMHLGNRGQYSDAFIRRQLVDTFFLGAILGIIKESKLGLIGAIGAHIGNNLIVIIPELLKTIHISSAENK